MGRVAGKFTPPLGSHTSDDGISTSCFGQGTQSLTSGNRGNHPSTAS